MLRYCLLFLGAIIYYGTSYSQQVIATDGNYVAASQGSLSWTLGEVITETFSNTNGFLTQGFQQKDKDDRDNGKEAAGIPNNMKCDNRRQVAKAGRAHKGADEC